MLNTCRLRWSRAAGATAAWVLALVPALLGAGCAPSPDPNAPDYGSTTTAPTTGTATEPTGTDASPAVSVVGTWASASCGDRTYPRHIDFAAGGTFSATDLVSPCPPQVVCVWSGIVHRTGRYSVDGDAITLTVSGPGGAPGKPFPASLGLDPRTGAPIETDSAGNVCPYERRPSGP